jgi:hypothetical protein
MSATYKIIGEDGKEYGPVSAGQLRQWLAEGRVESRTPVFVDGAKEWSFAGLLPEFASQLAPQIPQTIAPPIRARKASGFATTGMVFGALSLIFCCCYGFPCNILGLVFSSVALVQISRHPEIYEGRGLAITGLALSIASILIYGLLLAFALATGNFHIHWNVNHF